MSALLWARSVNGFVRFSQNSSSTNRQTLSLASEKSTAVSHGSFWKSATDCWRPTVSDVERISWGKPAKQKGTGSRGIPHRLNQEERRTFEQARRQGFLQVEGSGWRSQRRDSPLLNTFRSLCDARGQANIVLHKSRTGTEDTVLLDLSPLRLPSDFDGIAKTCLRGINPNGEIIDRMDDNHSGNLVADNDDDDAGDCGSSWPTQDWADRPIYQLPPFTVAWEMKNRSEAKALGKQLAQEFETQEPTGKGPSKKPVGVKPGKSRRHGGYGIG